LDAGEVGGAGDLLVAQELGPGADRRVGKVSPGCRRPRPARSSRNSRETFNFTRYGTVPAQVTWVTADAVNDDKRGAIFPATLELLARDIEVDGKRIALAPGMSLTAEIKTGRRRVIEYLLSPVQQRASSSLHER